MKRSKKTRNCPRCASKDVMLQDSFEDGTDLYVCADCDFEFEVGGSRSKHHSEDFDSNNDFDQETTEEEWEH